MTTVILKLLMELLDLIPYLGAYLEKREKRKKSHKEVHRIYSILLTIINNTAADRVSLLSLTNGGRLLDRSKNIYSTIQYEVNTKALKPLKSSWQGQKIDLTYRGLIQDLIKSKGLKLEIITEQLEAGDIKDIYENQGIEKSLVFGVSQPRRTFWYISIQYKSNPVLTAKERDAIRLGVNELEKIFSKQA